MLNQNYPRCIFIRTDCEIWAVKTWVIVALETDITHFPSRSRQWHANSVFNMCACGFFVWLLCKSVKELEDEEDWKGRRWEEGSRREMGVSQARHTFGVVMQESSSMFLHILPSPTCLSYLYLSASDPDLCPLWVPRCSFWRLFFTRRERERERRDKNPAPEHKV